MTMNHKKNILRLSLAISMAAAALAFIPRDKPKQWKDSANH